MMTEMHGGHDGTKPQSIECLSSVSSIIISTKAHELVDRPFLVWNRDLLYKRTLLVANVPDYPMKVTPRCPSKGVFDADRERMYICRNAESMHCVSTASFYNLQSCNYNCKIHPWQLQITFYNCRNCHQLYDVKICSAVACGRLSIR